MIATVNIGMKRQLNQLAYYSGFDGLFVNNSGGSSVLVFEGISTQESGAPSPPLILSGAGTGLSNQSGMAIDFTH